jgi:hypothetical protein
VGKEDTDCAPSCKVLLYTFLPPGSRNIQRLDNSFDNSHILFVVYFIRARVSVPHSVRPSAAFCALRSARDTHGNMFFISYLTIHQFSHNHGKLKYSSYYLCSLGTSFAITTFYVYCSICKYGIAKTSSNNKLLHGMCTSLASHWRHSYRLQKEAHHQNRIPSQRETYQTPSRSICGCSGFLDLNRLQLLPLQRVVRDVYP